MILHNTQIPKTVSPGKFHLLRFIVFAPYPPWEDESRTFRWK